MVVGLSTGLTRGGMTALGPLQGPWAWIANTLLALQFPLLHTPLLSVRGRKALGRFAPADLREDFGTTLFAIFASLQLLVTFVCWSPSGVVWSPSSGVMRLLLWSLFGSSWLLLGKAMWDASLALQTGALGWWAAFRGRRPKYPPMPVLGLFARWRQPIYTAFAAILVTAPVWTPDRLLLTAVWVAYCLVGPRFKERRYAARHGESFLQYRARTPYWLPAPLGRVHHR